MTAHVRPPTPADASRDFAQAIHDGFARSQKAIPSRFLYDARGSALFEEITHLEEYYPTRTEIGILQAEAPRIAENAGESCLLIEFGSGSSRKTELLLDELDDPAGYVPIDISPTALEGATERLAARFPDLRIVPLVADFSETVVLPAELPDDARMGFFPGSTIGNLLPKVAVSLLRSFAGTLGSDNALVIGVDLQKDPAVLHAAYNDKAGVTAAFNLNLLARANRELGANFDLQGFRHEAIYDEAEGRIEMHLVASRAQTVELDGRRYHVAEGESIHTENSYKYTLDGFRAVAGEAGWRTVRVSTDRDRLFSVHELRAAA